MTKFNKMVARTLSVALIFAPLSSAFADEKPISTEGKSAEQIQQDLLAGNIMETGDKKLGWTYACDPFLGELGIRNVDRGSGVINNHNFTRIVVADNCRPRVNASGQFIIRAGQQSARGNAASQWAAAIPGVMGAVAANFTGALRDLARDDDCCGTPPQPIQIVNQNRTESGALANVAQQTTVRSTTQVGGRCEDENGACQ